MNVHTQYGELSDQELVVAAKAGDDGALSYLFRRHYQRMYGLASRYSSNSETARDAVQEACVQVMRNIDRLRNEARFVSWMSRIVINAVRLHHRKFGRDIPAGEGVDRFRMEQGPAPDMLTDQRHELEEVHSFLSSRRNDELDLFQRLFVHGESFTAISEQTGVSTSALKTRVHRARKRLRDHMIDQGYLAGGQYRPLSRAVAHC
jgi:RNA polymerase sigma-70 factor, ECF subfamily